MRSKIQLAAYFDMPSFAKAVARSQERKKRFLRLVGFLTLFEFTHALLLILTLIHGPSDDLALCVSGM